MGASGGLYNDGQGGDRQGDGRWERGCAREVGEEVNAGTFTSRRVRGATGNDQKRGPTTWRACAHRR